MPFCPYKEYKYPPVIKIYGEKCQFQRKYAKRKKGQIICPFDYSKECKKKFNGSPCPLIVEEARLNSRRDEEINTIFHEVDLFVEREERLCSEKN